MVIIEFRSVPNAEAMLSTHVMPLAVEEVVVDLFLNLKLEGKTFLKYQVSTMCPDMQQNEQILPDLELIEWFELPFDLPEPEFLFQVAATVFD
jgi:hypothetical protein